MKICTVVLTHDTPLYNHFDSIKRKYLQSKSNDYYFVYNGIDSTKNNVDERNVNYYSSIQHPTGIPVMFEKFVYMIKSGMLDEYDYIIRVNSSTFVNLDVVKEHLNLQVHKNVCMGFYEPHWSFVSGACTIFSQSVLKMLCNHQDVDINREDDVVIGSILRVQGVQKTFLPRYSFAGLQNIPSTQDIQHALAYPQIRIRNDHNREVIDKAIWDQIALSMNIF